jgi:phage tail-like protein
MSGQRKDPVLSFNFRVELNGVFEAGFNEVSGLQAEIEVQEYREGGVNDAMLKFAGPVKFSSNLVLKNGITDSVTLWTWYQQVMRGQFDRRSLDVVLLDAAGNEKRRWKFKRAYPVKWNGPGLKATSSEVALESLELAHEGFAP